MADLLDLADVVGIAGLGDTNPEGEYPDMYGFGGGPPALGYYNGPRGAAPSVDYYLISPSGSPPAQQYYPHGSGSPSPQQLFVDSISKTIAAAAANAPHVVNSGKWGVPGYGWSNVWPVDPFRVEWFGPHVDKPMVIPVVSHRQAIDALRSGNMDVWYEYMLPRVPGPEIPLDETWPGEDHYWGAGDFQNV